MDKNLDKLFSTYGYLLFHNQRYQEGLEAYQKAY